MTGSEEKGQQAHNQNPHELEDTSQGATLPPQILQQADAVAASAQTSSPRPERSGYFPPIEDVPPPPYSAGQYGEVELNQNGFSTDAKVGSDGRVNIKIDQVNRRLTHILTRQLTQVGPAEPFIPDSLGGAEGLPPPPLNVVIQVVGSRGDVQPFVALGQVLKKKFNHRVRLATHPVFRDFVIENGLEFFSIGGDPAELMAFMVKNPGLIPGVEALRSGEIGKKRKGIYEMIQGCWRSCIEPGEGFGEPVSDALLDARSSVESEISLGVPGFGSPSDKPFVADAIIANPPSFAHIHIAEKMGIPLHLMFTMPWSPTQAYPHPLANITSSNTDQGMTNFMSYVMVDLLTWQGIGDVINRFREKTLKLEPISVLWAPGSLHRLKIPWTYAWSPALIPKPSDWSNFIDISGFFFLDLATNYKPPDDLARFLEAGPPPVYIGFGSIVVDDPNAMTNLIFEAVQMTGKRALVSKGWGGLAADELGQPDDVFMLGNCPHDWLFQRVSAVVHHGGAGTTAAGVKAGRPTVVVPFFGDQPFWGNMVNRAGAGPKPIPHKELTARNLADAILEALTPESLEKAQDLSSKIQNENGPTDGADSFHKFLGLAKLRCSLAPARAAVWRVKRTDIRLSALAATVLVNENLIDFSDLKLYRPREYEVDTGPMEPISGATAAILNSIGGVTASVADFPAEVLRGAKSASEANRKQRAMSQQTTPGSAQPSTSGLSLPVTEPRQPSNLSLPVASPGTRTPDSGTVQSNSTSENGEDDRYSVTGTSIFSTEKSIEHIEPRSMPEPEPAATPRWERIHRLSTCQLPDKAAYEDAGKITLGTAIGSAKATANIVHIGIKTPLDFTMSLAKGFHNLPRLYNDKTVRQYEKVTGLNSGLKVAGKTFAYGFMDGIGGVVTQPINGLKEEGPTGFIKGLVKGSLGLVVKPGAAIWGLPAYTMKGIYTEITRHFGKSTTNYIIAARMAQGYEDFQASSADDRDRIIAAWHAPEFEDRYQQKRSLFPTDLISQPSVTPTAKKDRLVDENGELLSGFRNTMHLTFNERKELARRKQAQRQSNPVITTSFSQTSDAEFRDAIREAVKRTSTNDTQQDRAIESAIWASVNELRQPVPQSRLSETTIAEDEPINEDEAFKRAVAASVAQYRTSQADRQQSGVTTKGPTPRSEKERLVVDDEDDELTRAITASLGEYYSENEPPLTSEEDQDLKRAMAESLKPQTTTITGELPRTTASAQHDADGFDAEMKEAIRQSEQQHTKETERQKNEEEIVMEYVKKQSLAEEEFRKRQAAKDAESV